MSAREGTFAQSTINYLATTDSRLEQLSAVEIAGRIRELVRNHEAWRGQQCLNLNAAEAVMSRRSRSILASDLATRVSEGFPADKEYPAPEQNVYIDEIEAILIHLAKQIFQCRFVEWRPVSTSMANTTVFHAFTKNGDSILSQSPTAGGNYSYNSDGPPAVLGLKVHALPHKGDCFEIDIEKTADVAKQLQPRLIVVGGSNVLFPYPVRQLREIADSVGALLLYDAAHLSILTGLGNFQNPLSEGAHLVTMSTHKIMGGAVGGMILMNDPDIAKAVMRIPFPALMQTRDQNKLAATAHALCEMLAHGDRYAQQVVLNSRALAKELERKGFKLFAKSRAYTNTHQIFLDLNDFGAQKFETLCQQSNILVSKTQHAHSSDTDLDQGGARLTTQEITRQGMQEKDMQRIAEFISRATLRQENPQLLKHDIETFLKNFYRIDYSFD